MIVLNYSFGTSSTTIQFAKHTKWSQPAGRKSGENVTVTLEVIVGVMKAGEE